MIKIKRPNKKVKLNEDDAPQAQAAPTNNAPAAAPATTAPAPAPAPAPTQQNNQQNAQPQQQNNQQQANQQNQQNQEQQQPSPEQQKITDAVNKLLGKDMIGNTYWVMSVNLPEEIQKMIPEFKAGNAKADPAIKAWVAYKKAPSQTTYNTFLDEFKKFGMPEQVQQQQLPNQQANQQANAAQPAAQPANNFMQTERALAAFNFNKALQENLNTAYKKNYYKNVLIDYFENI